MNSFKLFFLGLFLCVTTLTNADNSENTGALLWKISGNGLEKPSYVLGTFHLASKTMLDSIPGAYAALNDCEQIVGELVMSEAKAQTQKMLQAAMMPTDTTYQILYTEEEYKKVDEGVKSFLGVGFEQLGILKPGMISTTISVLMYQKFFPEINMNETMDNYVQEYALSAQKTILGLETFDEQMDVLFNSTSLKYQAEQLLCLFESQEYVHHYMVKIIEAYNNKDLAAIQLLFEEEDNAPCASSKGEEDTLLKNRNDNWIKKLPAIMQEKGSFIAVGAGHLVGNYGLLTQLRALGYAVEPVK